MTPQLPKDEFKPRMDPQAGAPLFPEAGGEAVERGRARAGGPRAGCEEPPQRSRGPRAAGGSFVPFGGESRGEAALASRAEASAILERQLLLAGGLGDEAPRSRRGWLRLSLWTAVPILLIAIALFSYSRVRDEWEGRVDGLKAGMAQFARESAAREQALREEGVSKDRQLSDRKEENQRLASLADKTLQQLESALDDRRRLEEAKLKLEEEYRNLASAEPFREFFYKLLPAWLKKGSTEPPGG